GVALRRGLQSIVRGHDADQRIGPVRKDEQRAHDPAPISVDPCRDETERRRYRSQSSLHQVAGVIAGLPLLEQIAVVERKPCRLLGEIDLKGRPGKCGGENKPQLTDKHRALPLICSQYYRLRFFGVGRAAGQPVLRDDWLTSREPSVSAIEAEK